MAANLLTIDRQVNSRVESEKDESFGKKIGLIASLFGCSHSRLTRPFSHGNVGYRTCLQCGARKKFDLETRTTSDAAYYPPACV
jgi:hypothetical protein